MVNPQGLASGMPPAMPSANSFRLLLLLLPPPFSILFSFLARITHVDAWFRWAGGKQVAVRVDATGLSVSNGLVLSEWKTALLSFAAPEAR